MSAIQEFIVVILKGNCNVYRLIISCGLCCMHLVQMLRKMFLVCLTFFVIDVAMKVLPVVRLHAFLLFYRT